MVIPSVYVEIKISTVDSLQIISPIFCINCAWSGKTCGAIGFALIFLWLLALYQDKECNITL